MWEWSKDISPVNKFIFPAPHPSSYSKNSLGNELLFIPPKEKLYHFYKQFKKLEKREKEKLTKRRNSNHKKHKRKNSNHRHPSINHNHRHSSTNNNHNHRPNTNIIHKHTSNTNINNHIKRNKLFACPNAIPCIYIERKYPQTPPTHLLLYFHGNAEDLGKTYPILDYVRVKLSVNVLCPEYPGYGISYGSACESSVAELVQHTYEFVISPYGLNVPPNRIIIYGFSIGSAASLSMSTFPLIRVPIPMPPPLTTTQIPSHKPNKQFFYSTFYKQCPHSYKEHQWLFNEEYHFFPDEDCDTYTDTTIDPFYKLPLASLLNILRKANINYPTSVNKNHLLTLARNHDLIPPITSCQKANIIRKYALIIIVCPFSSITQVVADKVGSFASYLLSERFDNTVAIPNIHGPLLIIHGRDDSIIPCEHSQMLFEIAQKNHIRCSIEILDGCDHNTMDLRRITAIINNFFQHQFTLCRSQRRLYEEQECINIQELYFKNNQKRMRKLISNGWGIQGFKKYSTTNNTMDSDEDEGIDEELKVKKKCNSISKPFTVRIPKYCYLRPRFDHPNTKAPDMVDIERERRRLKDEQEQKRNYSKSRSTSTNTSIVSSLPLSPASNSQIHTNTNINVSISNNNNNNSNNVTVSGILSGSDDDDEHPFIQLMKLFDIHVVDNDIVQDDSVHVQNHGRFSAKKYSNANYKKHFTGHPTNVHIMNEDIVHVKHKYPTSPKYPSSAVHFGRKRSSGSESAKIRFTDDKQMTKMQNFFGSKNFEEGIGMDDENGDMDNIMIDGKEIEFKFSIDGSSSESSHRNGKRDGNEDSYSVSEKHINADYEVLVPSADS